MVTIQQIMSVLSSTVHLHFLTKSQILLERSTHSSGFSMVYMKTSELLHLTGTENSSWGAVGGRCSRAWWCLWRYCRAGPCMGQDVIRRVLAMSSPSLYKCIKQCCSSSTVWQR